MSTLSPTLSYEETVQRIEKMIAAERPIAAELGLTRLMVHGHPTENAIVLLHGFTNCPQQFADFGTRFFELGYNVFIPRLPHHGLKDRLTRDLKNLRAEELLESVKHAVDLALGLGKRTTVAGLSLGGLLAVWVAQCRADVDVAVSIAPDLGLTYIPHFLHRPFIALLRALPDFYIWWDPRSKAANPFSYPFAYPGFSSHGVAELLRLALMVRQQIHGKPLARSIILITIGGDPLISKPEIDRVVRMWKKYAPGTVQTYEFDRSYHFPHDIITPESHGTRIDYVYPKIIELVTGQGQSKAG